MTDDLTTRLSRQLHEQADDVRGAPLPFESVRGRARSIRRTRRMVAAGVAAVAVVAITVPTALLTDATGRTDRDAPPVDVPSEAAEPTPRADGTFPLTLDVPEGPVPTTGYLTDGGHLLVTPDGSHELPGEGFVQIAPYDGGWVGIRAGDLPPTGHQVVVLDAGFEEVSAVSSGQSMAISSDGTRVAWIETRGDGDGWTVVNAPVAGGEPVRTGTAANAQVEGFLADDSVATSTFDDRTGVTSYGRADPEGEFEAIPLRGYQRVGGISEPAGLVAGQTRFRGDSTCSEVRRTDASQEQLVYRTCERRLGSFSPDGQLLIGYSSYSDFGSPSLAVLDAATGEPVVEFTSSTTRAQAAVVHEAAWEDADTVVAVVEQGAQQRVLRFETSGAVARTSEARDVSMSIEYFLPQALFGQ